MHALPWRHGRSRRPRAGQLLGTTALALVALALVQPGGGPSAAATAEPTRRPLVPTPSPPVATVDWPELPDVTGKQPLATTEHFAVYAAADDPLLRRAVRTWTPELEALLEDVGRRLGLALPVARVHVVFSRAYHARCPARGIASARRDKPLLVIYLDERTTARQVRAVLAHEMVHHLTAIPSFVGDGVLTEGIANWAAGPWMLAWQGYGRWSDAVLDYLRRGEYVAVSDDTGLSPGAGEDCLARRDRVYNSRAAFVGWLIDRIGLERVLEMPYVEVAAAQAAGRPAADRSAEGVSLERRPDYRRATGYDLRTLELLWLTELWLENH